MPPNTPYTRTDYSYRPNEWNPLEIILDGNFLRAWVNDGPEGGMTNGQADEEIAKYGPVALYVGGAGEVHFKQVELKDLGRRYLPDERVSSRFRMQRINDFYYGWSAAAADINRDGTLDIVSGPFYYLGPDYRVSREIYPSKTSNVGTEYTPAMVEFAYDYTGDGWPDVLVANGRPMSLYVNPKGELRRWDKYDVLPTITSEIAIFKDIDGDGKPDAVFVGGGAVCWASPDPADATKPWIVHQVSDQGYGIPNAQHGIGAGDINGDGRVDIVSPAGWWEQPPKGTPEGPWPYHSVEVRSLAARRRRRRRSGDGSLRRQWRRLERRCHQSRSSRLGSRVVRTKARSEGRDLIRRAHYHRRSLREESRQRGFYRSSCGDVRRYRWGWHPRFHRRQTALLSSRELHRPRPARRPLFCTGSAPCATPKLPAERNSFRS